MVLAALIALRPNRSLEHLFLALALCAPAMSAFSHVLGGALNYPGWISHMILFLHFMLPMLAFGYVRRAYGFLTPRLALDLAGVGVVAAVSQVAAVLLLDGQGDWARNLRIIAWAVFLTLSLSALVLGVRRGTVTARALPLFLVAYLGLTFAFNIAFMIEHDVLGRNSLQLVLLHVSMNAVMATAILIAYIRRPLTIVGRMPRLEGVGKIGCDEVELARLIDSTVRQGALFKDPDFGLPALARHMKLPARTVSYLVNAHLGEGVPAYLNRLRAVEAARLLAQGEALSVKAAMYDSGFTTKSAFNREFSRVHGLSPSDYRRARASGSSWRPEASPTPYVYSDAAE